MRWIAIAQITAQCVNNDLPLFDKQTKVITSFTSNDLLRSLSPRMCVHNMELELLLTSKCFGTVLTLEVVNIRVSCKMFQSRLVAVKAFVTEFTAILVDSLVTEHVPLVALGGRQDLPAFLADVAGMLYV